MTDAPLLEQHRRLTQGLLNPDAYPHDVDSVQCIETHISTLLLAGDFVYKLKKPLKFGFLDFTDPATRTACCHEEIRLNGRFAPDLYLGVSTITGKPDLPVMDGSGTALEHAVRMRRFPQDRRLDHVMEKCGLHGGQVDALADTIAAFHQSPVSGGMPPSPQDTAQGQLQPVLENIAELEDLLRDDPAGAELADIAQWTRDHADALTPRIDERIRNGFIRECHGDLHLANIVLLDDRPVPFDGIEFSAALRWIDVMNELAFLTMDFIQRGRSDFASRLLSRYLDTTGDHAGVHLLRFHQVYRSLVRAKINALRLNGGGLDPGERTETQKTRDTYLGLARALTRPAPATLTITCGLAGSGKSTAALKVVERHGAIRLRSDVERKRLQGLPALAKTASGVGTGLYGESGSRATYDRLEALADTLLGAGWSVIVDAACLRRAERDRFRKLAHRRGLAFHLVFCDAPPEVLRERIHARAAHGGDPSEADTSVLAYQLARFQPPDREELSTEYSVQP